jgi:O-antigen/teichoic acid export membrane protein
MRIAIFTLLLIMGLVGLCIFYIFTLRNQLLADLKYSIGLVLPLVAAIFTFLAYKRIKQDETLVRSYDRIR